MKEQFVTYDIALKLKELGFNEPCLGYYYTLNGKTWMFALKDEYNRIDDELNIGGNFSIIAPLWQQVIDWFREKHEIFIAINYWGKRNVTPKNSVLYPNKYNYTICQELTPKEKWIEAWYGNYNKAREQAILKAIELIQKQ